jgi:methionyl-tRNA formyltransferase
MDGVTETGVTTFQIAKSVDTGNVLMRREVPVNATDTYEDLYPRLARVGADLLVETIDGLESGSLSPLRQDDSTATSAPKITIDDSPIDWQKPASAIVNQIRGLAGSADAFTHFDGKRLKVFRASLAESSNGSHLAGEVIAADKSQGLVVSAGKGAVRLLEVCLEGKKRMDAQAFLNGIRIPLGTKLTAS